MTNTPMLPPATGVCALCKESNGLRNSHIVPAFVFRWVKETSATGYLRASSNPNRRAQDGDKHYLLCDTCEQAFSKEEREFKNHIFSPYASDELDLHGVATGKLKFIQYGEWLSRFSTSVHWRNLVHHLSSSSSNSSSFPPNVMTNLILAKEIWESYLMGGRPDPGRHQQHILFFQNLAAGRGYFPDDMPEQINRYILRAIDRTIGFAPSGEKVFSYVKLGPIVLVAYVEPQNPPVKANNTRIRKRGELVMAQQMRDVELNRFILIDRPKEVLPGLRLSDSQARKVDKSIREHPDRAASSMTFSAGLADFSLSRIKNKNK